jgi:ABC-2 type transport system permease protein
MTALRSAAPTVSGRTSVGRAVTLLAVRQVRWGAAIVTVLAGGMSLTVAATYARTVGSGPGVASLASLAGNPAIRTLFGTPVALGNSGGFTVWRTGTVLAVVFGVWGSLAITRITRGAEEAGRWDLLLAGRLSLVRAVAVHLSVIAAVMAVAGTVVVAALAAAGTAARSAVVHGAGLALLGMFFVGVAGLAAQIFPTRAAATGAAMGALGGGLLLRMVADGAGALAWWRWFTPFGLVELTRPYAADRVWPLLVLAVAAAAALAAGPAAAYRRDLHDGWLTPRTGRPARRLLLGSIAGFSVRRMVRPLSGWSVGVGAYFLLIGLMVTSLTAFLTNNPQFADLAARAGFGQLQTSEGYVATLFALLAVPIGAFVAARIAAASADESSRRLTPLFAGPVTRRAFLSAEVGAATGGAVVLAGVAGIATWVGTAAAGAGLGLTAALAGTVNVLPIVALDLGAAVLALGVTPRAVAVVGAVPTVGGFLLLVVTEQIRLPEPMLELSPFTHVAPVPATTPDWAGAIGMVAVAVGLAVIGGAAYERRDLRG